MSRYSVPRVCHVIFITLCLSILGTEHLFPRDNVSDDKHSYKTLINRDVDQHTTEQNSAGSQKGKQQSLNVDADLAAETVTYTENDCPIDSDLEELPLPLPPIEFARAQLAGWDREAEKLTKEGNLEKLIALKMRIITQIPKETQDVFLKADSAINHREWILAQNDPAKRHSANHYLEQCKASLEALHKISPDDPFYFFKKSFLYLRHENNNSKAMDIAQQGLTLLHTRENITLADNFYDWKLTQICAICLSAAGKNQEALKVVGEYKTRMEKLPEEERGLARETSMVINWLQDGKVFTHLVWDGKIQGQ